MKGKIKFGKPRPPAIQNPAWDYMQTVPPCEYQLDHYNSSDIIQNPDGSVEFVGHRSRVTALWSWAIPAPEILTFIVNALDGRSVVEVGAGCGYWAWMLTQYGVNVDAYDVAPVGHEGSWFQESRLKDESPWRKDFPIREYHPVAFGATGVLKRPEYANRVLFLCWPNYSNPFARRAVQSFQGDTIIYIGEGEGGCCGDDAFFEVLSKEWDVLDERAMVQWGGINDWVTIYTRKPS